MPELDAEIKPETVEARLETTRELIRAEDVRAKSLNGRGGALAGFAGITASVAGGLGAPALSSDLGDARWLAFAGLVLGLAGLLSALGIVVFGVLWPRTYDTIAIEEVDRYPSYDYVTMDRVMVQGSTLRGLVAVLASERFRNAGKARWLERAYVG